MRTKRFTITAFLLVAVMLLGVGFAAITDNLFIKGEAAISTTEARDEFDTDVYFTTAELHTNAVEGTDTVSVGQTDNDSATFEVKSLGTKDDYLMFKFTIKNASTEFNAKITIDTGYPQISGANADYFSIIYTNQADGSALNGDVICLAGGETVVYVKVTLTKSPQENITAAFNVNLTATSQA